MQALLDGSDVLHGKGDDLVMCPTGIAALQAAKASGRDLRSVSSAVSCRRYQAKRPLYLQRSFFATAAAAAAALFEGVLVGVLQPPPRSMMFAGLDREFKRRGSYRAIWLFF
jgi:hypothetical protein